MKFLPTILSAATANVSYKDILWNIREGKPLPPKTDRSQFAQRNFISWNLCPEIPKGNLEKLVCDDEYCMAVCPPGSQIIKTPENQNKKPKVRCLKGGTWNYGSENLAGIFKCSFCDANDFNSEPDVSDPFIESSCFVNTRNKKICTLRCKNGERITNRWFENVKCRYKPESNSFVWQIPRDKHLLTNTDTASYTCPRNPITGPSTSPVDTCMTKDPTCTTLGKNAIKYMNNWTCRNCFRIHAHYQFGQYGINNWEDRDYIDIFFRYKIIWLNYSHPIERVEQIGETGNQWRVYFKQGANFMSGMMWDANLMTVQKQWIKDDSIIRGSASCPCSNSAGPTPAPWK